MKGSFSTLTVESLRCHGRQICRSAGVEGSQTSARWFPGVLLLLAVTLGGCSGRDGEMLAGAFRQLAAFSALLSLLPAFSAVAGLLRLRSMPPSPGEGDRISLFCLRMAYLSLALMLLGIAVPSLQLLRIFESLQILDIALLALPAGLLLGLLIWIASSFLIVTGKDRAAVRRCAIASLILIAVPLILALLLWILGRR